MALNRYIILARRNLWLLVNFGAVALVAVLISFLYPNNVKFKYEFHRGQVWQYDDLEAPFDFAIKKSKEELEQDKALIIKDFWPFYAYNHDLADAKVRDFEAALDRWATEVGLADDALAVLKADGRAFLEQAYETGIVQLSPEHAAGGPKQVLNVVSGNVITKRTVAGFLSAEMARQSAEAHQPAFDAGVLPLVQAALVPNVSYDQARTEALLEEALREISPSRGLVVRGELIVQKGNVVTDEVFAKLVSYRERFESDIGNQKSAAAVYFGYLLLTVLILGAFMMYVNSYRREILSNWKYLTFVLSWLVIFSYLTFLVERIDALSIYVIPFCVVPVVVRHFFTYRLAFFTHVVVVLIAGFLTSEGHQFLFTQIVAGVVAVLAVADARDWTRFFTSVLAIVLAYSLSHVGMSLIEEGSFSGIDWQAFGWLIFNGVLTLLAFPLIPLAERIFGFTSAISLVELADMNRPLLRELALKAPGTFQHSLQVGNLAEAAANEIGADPLLVRVGALYHDIGKMKRPEYFVENQSGSSPHEHLGRLESAAIIIGHVPEGERLAKKYGLPNVLTRFILTHHGTTKVEYFYKNYLLENPDVEVDVAAFTYPGPKPSTKEEAVLMLADSVEATARSLKNPTGQDIDRLVEKIFKSKLDSGQLNDSKLTFSDLETCRSVFQKMLRSIHHVRIEYPE